MGTADLAAIVCSSGSIGQFFGEKVRELYRGIIAYLPGLISITLVAIIIGTIIDLAIKH